VAAASHTLRDVLDNGGAQLIEGAVKKAESRTSGQIVVRITQQIEPSGIAPRLAAVEEFNRLHVSRTKRRNGILVFIALNERAVELVADDGIATVVAQHQWQQAVEMITVGFRANFPAHSIAMAVTKIGDLLAEKFPPETGGADELPDEVISDSGPVGETSK
jgi:uncharacterized membrane protein